MAFDLSSASENAEASELKRMIAVEHQKAQFEAQVANVTTKLASYLKVIAKTLQHEDRLKLLFQ